MSETYQHTATEIETDLTATPQTFQAKLAEFVGLEKRRRELEDELKSVEARTAPLQASLLEQFADLGMQSANVYGLCVYVRLDRYVSKRSGVATETVCEALKVCGLGYMVSDGYNAQSLKSKIKEYQDQQIEVPPQLAELLNCGEVPRLVTRR